MRLMVAMWLAPLSSCFTFLYIIYVLNLVFSFLGYIYVLNARMHLSLLNNNNVKK